MEDTSLLSSSNNRRLVEDVDNEEHQKPHIGDPEMKKFLLMAFQRVEDDPDFWEALPDVWKQDRDITLASIQAECCRNWSEVALELRSDQKVAFAAWQNGLVKWPVDAPCLDHAFWRNALVEGNSIDVWDELPYELQRSENFARSFDRFTLYIISSMFRTFPDLRQDRNMWVKIIDSGCDFLTYIVASLAPVAIRGDRELMVKACVRNESVLKSVDLTPLQTDSIFLEMVLDAYPLKLLFLSEEAIRLFPDLVQSRLEPFSRHLVHSRYPRVLCERLSSFVFPGMQQDRNFIKAWFRAGLPFEPVIFPDTWKGDKELFLLIAEYCRHEFRLSSFACASHALRNDKDFMKQVVALDGSLFLEATPDIKEDFDLGVLAFAGSRDTVEQFYAESPESRAEMQRRVREKLTAHSTFVNPVLCAVSMAAPTFTTAAGVCPLPLLNQGVETSLRFKSLIAEYVGVPTGRDLRLLRLAERHLRL